MKIEKFLEMSKLSVDMDIKEMERILAFISTIENVNVDGLPEFTHHWLNLAIKEDIVKNERDDHTFQNSQDDYGFFVVNNIMENN